MSATGAVSPGRMSDLKKRIAGFDFGRIKRNSPRRTAKRKKPVISMAEAKVASRAGISTKAMSQPFTNPTAAIERTARMIASGPGRPALISVQYVVAPATIAATCDRSRPREMTTTAMPQLRRTRDVELERMTERFPSVAKPGMVNAKRTINPSVTARTIGSSRLLRGLRASWTGAVAVASDIEPHLVGALGVKDLPGLGGACDVERKLLQDPADLEHLGGARGREQSPAEEQAVL